MIIGLDVDGVLADLHAPWISWGNQVFGTNHVHFLEWDDAGKWWGPGGYKFLTPEIYLDDTVKPIWATQAVVARLRELGHEIRFVTSCTPGSEDAKYGWLLRHGYAQHEREFLPMHDKSGAPVDILVDDGAHNVEAFGEDRGILVTAPYNWFSQWRGPRISHIAELVRYHHFAVQSPLPSP
jgi:5'(3')-deoxyribonucleotidase